MKGCINISECECKETAETPLHYFLKCNLYNIHKPIMMQTLSTHVHHALDPTLSDAYNSRREWKRI